MNASNLASLMLDYEAMQRRADALRTEIEAAVLALGKTQTVGNVRATFTAGRRTFDYRAAVATAELEPGQLAPFESLKVDYYEVVQAAILTGLIDRSWLNAFTETVIDYTAAAKDLGLEAPVIDQKPPSVTVKLLA